MDELIIKPSRVKHSLLLLASALFVVAGIWMGLDGNPIGWMSALFFGAGIPLFAWELMSARPRDDQVCWIGHSELVRSSETTFGRRKCDRFQGPISSVLS